LREAINELNALNFGSIFLLRDCGVVLSFRDPLLRRAGAGFEERLELTLERIERDLALCREVLEEVVRTGVVHAPRMRKAYIQSVAQSLRNPVTLREIQLLANLSGYFTQRSGNVLGLSRSPRAIRGCPVRLTVECGVIQFWALPGRERLARRAGLLGRLAGDLRGGRRAGRSSLEGILKVLNGLNEESGLWRYLLKEGRVYALAAHLPQAGRIQHDEFQMIMESLFRTTREGVNQTAIFSLASHSPATSSRQ
jgi:hypothetical protein